MNDTPTTQHSFLDDYTIGMVVVMRDKDNGGRPSLSVMVVPRETHGHAEAVKVGRPLMEMLFNEGTPNTMRFYNPDGSIYLESGPDSGSLGKVDNDINGDLNEAWTGDRNSPLMDGTQDAVTRTVMTMIASSALAGASDGKAQDVFEQLMRNTRGVAAVERFSTKQEETSHEG